MIKLESDIWSNSNMWLKLLPIYGQSQIYSQILYDQTQIHGQTKILFANADSGCDSVDVTSVQLTNRYVISVTIM